MRALVVLALVPLALACIQSPTWAVPATPSPGGTFVVKASSPVTSVYALADGKAYQLSLVKAGKEAVVKVDLPPGLYDLEAITKDGKCYQHHALWVVPNNLDKITIMHLTDEHFGVYTDRWAYQYVLAAVFIANSDPQINAIFVTGDVADTAMPYQYEMARLVHGLLLKPVFVVPGNHDHVNPIDAYSEYVGPHTWRREVGKILIVGLDTGAEGYLSYSQAQRAYEMLKGKEKVKVVLFHHPLVWNAFGLTLPDSTFQQFYESVKAHAYRSWLADPEGFEEFLKALYYNKVTATFSGHVHLDECAVGEPQKLWMVVTTTTGGPVRKGDYRGFRIATVSETINTTCKGRHQSYSLEGAYAQLGRSDSAYAVIFKVSDPKLLKLMPQVVIAVPVPKDFKNYKVYAPGAVKVWKSCSPAFCAVYAAERPELNKVYRLAVYVKPDEEAPQVLNLTYPKSVKVGEPVTISFVAKDDSWGIANATVIAKGPGYSLNVKVASYNGSYKFQAPPAKEPGKLKFEIILEDYYGHKTTKSFEVNVEAPQPKVVKAPQPSFPATPLAVLGLLALAALLLFFI